MQEKLNVIKEHGTIEYIYYRWIWLSNSDTKVIGRWSYPNVKITSEQFQDTPAWEIDGKTVKALARRGFIEPLEYKTGKHGKYPIKYKLVENNENNY